MENEKQGFGLRLKYKREYRMLTQAELAKKIGLHPSAIGHFEKERRKPSFCNIIKLSKGLTCTVSYIFGMH